MIPASRKCCRRQSSAWGSQRPESKSLVDAFFAVARLDKASLGFERRQIDPSQFVGNVGKRCPARGEGLDQPLVGALAFTVRLSAIGGGDVHVAVDQPGQVD